jgi:DNA-binding response OmpR family regulator
MELLIIEDDGRMASLLKRGLEEEGHVATLASNGIEGLHLTTAKPFDVVILDIMLPKMNGVDVVQRLRQQSCQTPVLMLTARDTPQDIVLGLDRGADDYLTKPFSFE